MEGICIVGAGGIGCAVGYALCAAGVPVTFVEVDGEKVEWGLRRGVCVDRHPPLPAGFCLFDAWHPPRGATVLLCTKCYNNAEVLERIPSDTALVPIQNGFDPLISSRRTPAEGIASFVSECLQHQTHTRITRQGRLHLGGRGLPMTQAEPDPRITALANALRKAKLFRTIVVTDILPYKHSKLMYNAAISPLAAVAGLDNGQLLSMPQARRLFFALLQENYAILTEARIPLAKIGPFHPNTVARILRRPAIARALAWAFYPTLRGTYCSMSGDLPTGRTEIDYYNRYLIDLAGERPCPLNRCVYELVKRMEREGTARSLCVLDVLLA